MHRGLIAAASQARASGLTREATMPATLARNAPSAARLRAFVLRHTRLTPVPEVPGLRLHLADDAMRTLRLAADELGQPDPPLPFWAFAWSGGLAVARYLVDHSEEVVGRRVVDVGSGSGLCAITALRLGATSALALDVDPLAEAAVALNARANGVQVAFRRVDPLGGAPPEADVVLAGDVSYEETLANRMMAWLGRAHDQGARVLVGDPGRRYLALDLEPLASYDVRTTREIEDAEVKRSTVFTLGS